MIPAFNERQGIEKCIRETYSKLDQLLDDFEIIVVDDASSDGTFEVVCELKQKENLSRLKVLKNKTNIGQGSSLKVGLYHAKKPILAHNSVDMPFSNDDWPKLLENMQNADMVVVERTNRDNYGLYRKTISHTFVFLINTLFSQRFSDYSFVQAFKRDTYLECVQNQVQGTALFMPSLIISAAKKKKNISKMRTKFRSREVGKATGASFKNIICGLYELFLLRLGVKR